MANIPYNLSLSGDFRVAYLVALTDASKEYDGFGTFEVSSSDCGVCNYTNERTRLVLMRAQYADWQLARYRSGMHAAWTDDKDVTDALCMSHEELMRHIGNVLFERMTRTV